MTWNTQSSLTITNPKFLAQIIAHIAYSDHSNYLKIDIFIQIMNALDKFHFMLLVWPFPICLDQVNNLKTDNFNLILVNQLHFIHK